MPDAFVTGQVTPVPPHTAVLFNVKLIVFPLTGMSFENSVALNVAVLPTVPDPCTLISDVAAGVAPLAVKFAAAVPVKHPVLVNAVAFGVKESPALDGVTNTL